MGDSIVTRPIIQACVSYSLVIYFWRNSSDVWRLDVVNFGRQKKIMKQKVTKNHLKTKKLNG